jgi:hypothetical protein
VVYFNDPGVPGSHQVNSSQELEAGLSKKSILKTLEELFSKQPIWIISSLRVHLSEVSNVELRS